MEVELSADEARRLALYGQFSFTGSGDDDLAGIISHLGYLQIDSISVIQRAHHHVMWSRNHAYRRGVLTRLQKEPRRIFEYWSHAAAYLPMEHYRFCLPRMKRIQKNGFPWYPRDNKAIKYAFEKITAEGPLQAKDFKGSENRSGTGWWDWKPMKIALEHLFQEGRIMVVKRNNFQKVYDLPKRVLPIDTPLRKPTDNQMASFLIDNALRSLGVASEADMSYQRKDGIQKIKSVLAERVKKGEIKALGIKGVSRTYYVHRDLFEKMNAQPDDGFTGVRILSPFDNQVIIRRRLQELFDFQYQLECYVPREKRVYGYFSLPVLYDRQIVGIIDVKAFRKEKVLAINNLHISQMPEKTDDFVNHLNAEIDAFKSFNQCAEVEIKKVYPEKLNRVFKK